ncbi:MAG: cytochrome b/b6 domain-containing protein [Anaerolineales bacterium]|nr:cytochrome b/b6 domain-containing protein [Anaerolineales bacterium]
MIKRKALIAIGILILVLAFGFNLAFAQEDHTPVVATASPIHPGYAMLDADGANVLESGRAASTMQTCGQCHDTEFIASHSYHADLGLGDYETSAETWNASDGVFGEFDPLTYRYLSAKGDERLDLTTPDWLKSYGWRVPGGGPAVYSRSGQPLVSLSPDAKNPEASVYDRETGSFQAWDWSQSGVIEMNCFLCHMTTPNDEMRIDAIERGDFGWANTATLAGTGIVERSSSGNGLVWNPAAFDEKGELKEEFVQLRDPTNENCAACHGEIHEDPITPLTLDACNPTQTQTATTGQVIASQKVSESGLNLSDKASLNRAWDIHAERALKCTDCHYSLNNPAHALDEKAANPVHLTYDPRKLEIGEYLEKPDHNFARGVSAQFRIAPELKSTMRRCESCHDTNKAHANWLPYNDRHMQVVACETCHIPEMHAPAYSTVDWTVVRPDGDARTECRGIEGANPITDLVTGYQPVLMQRTDIQDGKKLLAPYNMVTAFFWIYEDAHGNLRPVRKMDLEAAYLSVGGYAPDVLSAFDESGDGVLADTELVLNTEAKQSLITGKLESLGLKNVRIYGQVQPYSINHNVVDSSFATRDCTTCHHSDSRVTAPILLAESAPTGVTPEFATGANVAATGSLFNENGSLYYNPVNEKDRTYIFGHNRVPWIDWLGAFLFLGTLAGVAGHGTVRYYVARKRGRQTIETNPVYMYEVYERFWHWLQTVAIVVLLLTGLIIHRPDMFGAFSFRHVVTIHNVLAALLGINALISILWHLISGEIQQYIPHPYGFIDQMIAQAKYYIQGIFNQEPHPFHKTKQRKFNPLQMITYIGLLGVLLPLQGLSGIMMWLVQKVPAIQDWFGGLPFLAPLHTLNAWLFAAFIIAHVYLTTTAGIKPLDAIEAMATGWEDMEVEETH